jgi:hypothetical protein
MLVLSERLFTVSGITALNIRNMIFIISTNRDIKTYLLREIF